MPQNLTDITISEVSLVDAPANKGARVMLFKRAECLDKKTFSAADRKQAIKDGAARSDGSFPIYSAKDVENAVYDWGRAGSKPADKAHIIARAKAVGATSSLPEGWTKRAIAKDGDGDGDAALFDDTVDATEADEDAKSYAQGMCEEIQEANCALYESIQSILCDDEVTDKQAMLAETFDQYKAHIQAIVPEEMEKAFAIAQAAVNKAKEKDQMTQDEFKKALADEIAKVVAPLNETIAKLGEENAVLKLSDKHKSYMDAADMSDDAKKKFMAKSPDERDAHMADNPIEKKLPAHIQKALAEGEEMRKRLTALEDDKALTVLTKRAVDSGLPSEFGAVLQKAERGDKEAIAKLLEQHAQLAKSRAAIEKTGKLFSEFGTGRGAAGSALDQLNVMAEELRKADPKLTPAQAFTKVYADPANRELAEHEKRERLNKAAGAPVAA